MLDRVGQVGVPALDPGFLERFVEEAPRRTDEGAPVEILAVAGLLADEDEPSALPALAEDRLGRVAPERACPAVSGGFAERCQREAGGSGRPRVPVSARVEVPDVQPFTRTGGRPKRPSTALIDVTWCIAGLTYPEKVV